MNVLSFRHAFFIASPLFLALFGCQEPKNEFWCPMHPHVVEESAGKCPICGMPFSKREAGIIKLNSRDRELAQSQEECPISKWALGSAGMPFKITIRGKPIFLCCPRCEAEALADPEKTLATVKRNPTADAGRK